MEKKLFTIGEVKFASHDDDTKSFSGYGAVFGNVDRAGDLITKGAFTKTLKSSETPLMFLNHNMNSLPIGRWTKIEEDDYGLKMDGVFLDTTTGRDAYIASKAGAISGLSIGYIARDVVYGKSANDPSRTLNAVDLVEVSVVTIPCNSKATITSVKSLVTDEDHEHELMRLGMSAEEAKSFLASIKDRSEAKYNQEAVEHAASNLLSKLLGES
jgi:HK97 family phage prohead protease